MTARFRVSDTFTLASRGMLMLIGDTTEGSIRVGARIVSGPTFKCRLPELTLGTEDKDCRVRLLSASDTRIKPLSIAGLA